jgi:hypothetical protein
MKPSQSILAVFALVAATTVAAQDAQPKQSAPPGGQSSGATLNAPQAATGVAARSGVLVARCDDLHSSLTKVSERLRHNRHRIVILRLQECKKIP